MKHFFKNNLLEKMIKVKIIKTVLAMFQTLLITVNKNLKIKKAKLKN